MYINQMYCMSVKKKNCMDQCPNKRKPGSEYCGVHGRAKKITRVNQMDISMPISTLHTNIKITQMTHNDVTEILRKHNDDTQIGSLIRDRIRYTAKQFGFKYTTPINTMVLIYNFFMWCNYLNDSRLSTIVRLQSFIRMWLVYRRSKTNNREDFATLMCVYDIPREYYVHYVEDGFVYGFDFRSLNALIQGSKSDLQNPFSLKSFNMEDLQPKINSIQSHLKCIGKNSTYDIQQLTPDQKYTQLIVKVFQTFDLLGQYTDTQWFELLSMSDLKKLYKGAEDIFNYRAELSSDMKKKVVKNGVAFNNVLHNLENFQYKHKRFLQEEILNEFLRFGIEGHDNETKKFGTNLMLTALVEVSPEAAEALPHLVQSTF